MTGRLESIRVLVGTDGRSFLNSCVRNPVSRVGLEFNQDGVLVEGKVFRFYYFRVAGQIRYRECSAQEILYGSGFGSRPKHVDRGLTIAKYAVAARPEEFYSLVI